MFFHNNTSYLLEYAEEFINTEIRSMWDDVSLCLSENKELRLQPAPFAALLVCFSILDLLAALYAGNASKNSPTTSQVRKYLNQYFNYKDKQKDLLMSTYRHKLVHLYQPAPVFGHKGKWYSWQIFHSGNKGQHLKLMKRRRILHPAHFVILRVDYVFSIVITQFVKDIEKSSKKYLEALRSDHKLQEKFDKALSDIFSIG